MQHSLFSAVLSEPDVDVKLDDPLSQGIEDAVFTVIDCETTGLNKQKNALTEITAIRYIHGVEQAKFSTLVQPTEQIPPEAEHITGITNDMVKGAPPVVSVLHDLCSFVGPNPIIVGHNVMFDIGFIREKLAQNGMTSLQNRFDPARAFCTKVLAQKATPGLPSYEGIVVATSLGVNNPNPHRAEADVRMSAGILFQLIARLREQSVDVSTAQALMNFQGPLT